MTPARVLALLVLAVACVTVLGAGVAGADGLPSGSDTTLVVVDHDHGPAQPTVDENVTVTTTIRSVENGDEDYFVAGVWLYGKPDARGDVLASNTSDELLAPGGAVEKSVETDFDSAGRKNLSLRIRLETTDGQPVTLVRPVTLRVRDSHPEVALRATRVDRAGETGLNLTVANGLDRPIRSLSLRLRGEDVTVAEPERVRSVLGGGETTTFRFTGANASVGEATMRLRLGYTAPDGERRVLRRELGISLQSVRNPANVTLTDIDVTETESGVEIRGSASNAGGADARSVQVAVVADGRVRPAESGSSFFVGTVPASDFSAFDVTASVSGNASVSIPLRVSFVADGVTVERTVHVRYDPSGDALQSSADGGGDGGGMTLLAVVGLVVVAGAIAWRRYR